MSRPRARIAAAILASVALVRAQAPAIPAALADKEFWALSEALSEPAGSFPSDNFLSNERGYQTVIPELLATAKPGGIYLGVGPEQNFPYIAALKPRLAIIFDIRRGNLHEHLLYKAVFELSKDRADFLSRLFSRERPAGLTTATSVAAMMAAYQAVRPSEDLYAANLAAVRDQLTKRHGFALHPEDLDGIAYVYRNAFFAGGPMLSMSTNRRGSGCCDDNGTYADIQSLHDGTGLNRGFLGSEAAWLAVKDLHARNLIVPVVGDFAGPKAIRAVGKYLKEHGAVVSAFYLSNVEDWLERAGTWQAFRCNVAALPLDAASTFIYTGAALGSLNTTHLRPMLPDTRGCGTGVSLERVAAFGSRQRARP
jgi:hypothetical protein